MRTQQYLSVFFKKVTNLAIKYTIIKKFPVLLCNSSKTAWCCSQQFLNNRVFILVPYHDKKASRTQINVFNLQFLTVAHVLRCEESENQRCIYLFVNHRKSPARQQADFLLYISSFSYLILRLGVLFWENNFRVSDLAILFYIFHQ